MNGMGLFVLLETFTKVSLLAVLAQAGQLTDTGEYDFGWQLGEDNALEYIVQISPQAAQQMQTQRLENPSDMPPQLVGRATRIVVRIGNALLPRVPTLAEIERTIPRYSSPSDVTAALGPGRVSEVEGQVLNVQNGAASGNVALPPLPNGTGLSNVPLAMPGQPDNLIDQARAADASATGLGQAASEFLQQTRQPIGNDPANFGQQPTTAPSPTFPPANPPANPGNNTFTNPANNAATNPTVAPGAAFPSTSGAGEWPTRTPTQPMAPAPSGLDRWAAGTTPATDPGRTGAPGSAGSWGNAADPRALDYRSNPPRAGDPYASEEAYAASIAQRGQMPGRPLADAIPNNYQGYPQQGYAGQDRFVQDRFVQDQFVQGGGANGDPNRFGNIAQREAAPTRAPAGSASDVEDDADTANKSKEKGTRDDIPKRSGENFLQVFFLLSLVVNCYLGVLIRKLLGRYRTLLASVRSQTA